MKKLFLFVELYMGLHFPTTNCLINISYLVIHELEREEKPVVSRSVKI